MALDCVLYYFRFDAENFNIDLSKNIEILFRASNFKEYF